MTVRATVSDMINEGRLISISWASVVLQDVSSYSWSWVHSRAGLERWPHSNPTKYCHCLCGCNLWGGYCWTWDSDPVPFSHDPSALASVGVSAPSSHQWTALFSVPGFRILLILLPNLLWHFVFIYSKPFSSGAPSNPSSPTECGVIRSPNDRPVGSYTLNRSRTGPGSGMCPGNSLIDSIRANQSR